MQFLTLAALIGTAMAAANPAPFIEARATPVRCSSIQSCVTTNGNPASATSFCASYNGVPYTTTTSTYTAQPTDCKRDLQGRQVVDVLAPQKPRCFKKYLDGHLSKACSCIVTGTDTITYTYTTTSTAACAVTS